MWVKKSRQVSLFQRWDKNKEHNHTCWTARSEQGSALIDHIHRPCVYGLWKLVFIFYWRVQFELLGQSFKSVIYEDFAVCFTFVCEIDLWSGVDDIVNSCCELNVVCSGSECSIIFTVYEPYHAFSSSFTSLFEYQMHFSSVRQQRFNNLESYKLNQKPLWIVMAYRSCNQTCISQTVLIKLWHGTAHKVDWKQSWISLKNKKLLGRLRS